MARNNADKFAVDYRRRLVAQFRLRGLTQREIIDALQKAGCINNKDGKPWSLGTINSDLKKLDQQWRKDASDDFDKVRAQVLAETRELRRSAWLAKDYLRVDSLLKNERQLLGLDAPQKIAPTTPDGKEPYVDITDAERADRITAILDAARARRA